MLQVDYVTTILLFIQDVQFNDPCPFFLDVLGYNYRWRFCVRAQKGMLTKLVAASSLSGEDHNNLKLTLLVYDTSGCSFQGISWSPGYRYLNRSKLASTRLRDNHIMSPFSRRRRHY